VATNVSTPQADTECPSANTTYSSLRYKKKEKFAPYIPIAKARGFTAFSGKEESKNEFIENNFNHWHLYNHFFASGSF
jgi:hypothetical protein